MGGWLCWIYINIYFNLKDIFMCQIHMKVNFKGLLRKVGWSSVVPILVLTLLFPSLSYYTVGDTYYGSIGFFKVPVAYIGDDPKLIRSFNWAIVLSSYDELVLESLPAITVVDLRYVDPSRVISEEFKSYIMEGGSLIVIVPLDSHLSSIVMDAYDIGVSMPIIEIDGNPLPIETLVVGIEYDVEGGFFAPVFGMSVDLYGGYQLESSILSTVELLMESKYGGTRIGELIM